MAAGEESSEKTGPAPPEESLASTPPESAADVPAAEAPAVAAALTPPPRKPHRRAHHRRRRPPHPDLFWSPWSTGISVWSHQLLLNTDKFVGTVAPILKDPAVTKELGNRIAGRGHRDHRPQEAADRCAAAKVDFIAGPIIGQVRDQLAKGMTTLLRNGTVYKVWTRILRFTHEQGMALLRGNTKVVKIQGDKVVLDLVPLVAYGLQQLQGYSPVSSARR